jgi:hypothetical protein
MNITYHELSITLFKSITILCGTNNMILSVRIISWVPQNIVMNMNNVMNLINFQSFLSKIHRKANSAPIIASMSINMKGGIKMTSLVTLVPCTNVQVWSMHMHFNVKGLQIITLHSNFQTFLQHFTILFYFFDIGCFVLNMKIIWCLTMLKKYMQ